MNLRILVPEATTNYITNPSFRYDTTGWFQNGIGTVTLSRSFSAARFGFSSLSVLCEDNTAEQGVFYRASNLSGVISPITASVYVRGIISGNYGAGPARSPRLRLRLIDNPVGKEWKSKTVSISNEKWTRIAVTGISTGNNDIRIYIECVDATGGSGNVFQFYVDGVQLELKPYATSYCDGDQPGCRWNLIAHGSTSSRDAYTRAGGKWVPLAGPCRPNNDIYVTVLGGFGMPPLTNNIQPWANAPGSYFQNLKILNRVVTMTFHAKNESRLIGSPKLNNLYELRQQLIDIIKPDRTQGSEAFLFEYDDGERPLYMRFRYEAGLEGEWDIRNQWVNSFPIRLLAVDPFWVEDNQNVSDLDFSDTNSSATSQNLWARINGRWGPIKDSSGRSPTFGVDALAIGPKGELYLAGNFTTIGNRIVKWDGLNFTELGVGGANGEVRAIAVASDGTVYAVGDFTAIGGVAATRAAKYNPTTNTWSALSTGLNNSGYAVCVAPNGQVYMGGLFTTAGGVTMNYITRWDGLQFRTVGSPTGVSTTVRALVNAGDGNTMYMAGDFLDPSPSNYDRLASIDLTTNLITYMDGGDASIYALAIGKDGTLYYGGSFTVGPVSPSPVRKRIAYIQGGSGHQLGDGFTSQLVQAFAVGPDGTLVMGGSFTTSGTLPTLILAQWFKGVMNALDFIPIASSSVTALAFHPNGDLYVGASALGGGNSYVSGITTVTNEGTAEVQPQVYILGSGILKYLENWTTKKKVFLNLTLFAGEEVVIDFAKASITSSVRGNLMGYVLNGSDFKSFSLLPGPNQIAAFMTNDVGGLMKISYTPVHWSADAVIDAEELA